MKVCNCYDVTKVQLIKAIHKYSIDTITDLQNATKASTGCGRCKNVVKEILQEELEKQDWKNQQLRLPF
ncbi:MAG TPA: (2Fe-2S)-binding protein [Williamwhitmania sp.]|nr:(2Fe-2S)-binding protein [Williamwhitmania sp.]